MRATRVRAHPQDPMPIDFSLRDECVGARALRMAVACALIVFSGCRGTTASTASSAPPTSPSFTGELHASVSAPASPSAPTADPEPAVDLAPEWDRETRTDFEDAARSRFPDGQRTRLTSAALTDLASALAGGGERAVRAAILLARSRDPAALETLLANLERRVDREAQADPTGDACDVIAAAGLCAPDTGVRDCGRRLEALGLGSRPHPDLDVRVECASSALALGRERAIPFLVRVLREGTSAQAARVDWKRGGDVAFAQIRAAEALARRAGVEALYRPDDSLAERAAEAARFERILVPPQAKKR